MATIEESTRVISEDGESVLCELKMQEGGAAATLQVKNEDWLTPTQLLKVAEACQKMASKLTQEV